MRLLSKESYLITKYYFVSISCHQKRDLEMLRFFAFHDNQVIDNTDDGYCRTYQINISHCCHILYFFVARFTTMLPNNTNPAMKANPATSSPAFSFEK